MKYILSIVLFWSLALSSMAQDKQDELIFKAMNDEMERSLEQLKLPNAEPPFYLAYTLGRTRQFAVSGALGSVISVQETPWTMSGSIQMFLGDYHRNSNVGGGRLMPVSLPNDVTYDGIRRGFWQSTDVMYKASLQMFMQKTAYLKNNPLSSEEEQLDDWQQLPAKTYREERTLPFEIDLPTLEKIVKEVSAVFLNYKEIYNTSVAVTGVEADVYKITSEGTSLKVPQGIVSLQVFGMIDSPEGSALMDNFSVFVRTPGELPSVDELKRRAVALAEGLIKLKNAPRVEDFYSGPVLFEDGAVASIFSMNLLQPGALLAYRELGKPAQGIQGDRFGRQIVDGRLTVKNYTTLDKYNGIELYGKYSVDAEGVIPQAEMTLVENGVFKQMLNGREPALNALKSTGSSRFRLPPSEFNSMTAPGTVHVQATKTTKAAKMKDRLMKLAKAKGLQYAYIVKSVNGPSSRVFRVDVKTGEGTQMRAANIALVNLSKLMALADISDKENVDNYVWNGICFSSLIYPAGLIVESLDINSTRPKNEKAPALKYPLQR